MLFTFSYIYIYIYIDFCLFLFFSTIIKIFSVLNLSPSQGVLNPKSTNLIPKPTTVAQPHPHVDKSPNLLYIRLLLHIKLIPVKKQSFKLLAASSIEKNVLQLTRKLKTRCNLYELSLPSSSFYQPPIPLPKTVSLKRKWSFLTLLSNALIKKYSYIFFFLISKNDIYIYIYMKGYCMQEKHRANQLQRKKNTKIQKNKTD